ncbi:DUF2785 domain-containing protein [Microbacteriaceae bacterium 4G12]
MDEKQLKQELKQIKNNHYAVPDDVDAYPYAQWMLAHIGSTDAELRDSLIYSTLAHWIQSGVFRQKELRGLLLQSMNDLFYEIDEKETDAVFRRAFSVLIPPLILSVHEKEPLLSLEQLYSVADQVLEYAYLEKDARGYVEGKGWAHSTAHTADALAALARNLHNREFGLALLDAVFHKVCVRDYLYIHFEDERLVTVIMTLLEQHILSAEDWKHWLHHFTTIEKAPVPQNDILIQNIRMFLRSMYFRVLEHEEYTVVTEAVLKTLKEVQNLVHG